MGFRYCQIENKVIGKSRGSGQRGAAGHSGSGLGLVESKVSEVDREGSAVPASGWTLRVQFSGWKGKTGKVG
jgi:hypothetical protein